MERVRAATRKSEKKRAFLSSLARDLRAIGIKAGLSTRNGDIVFNALIPDRECLDFANLMGKSRELQVRASASVIDGAREGPLADLLVDGDEIDVGLISPRIYVCRTPVDFALFRYCRLLQTVPSANRIGRQICALVFDDGQARPVLMGAIGLASCLYTVTCRDRHLGWLGKGKVQVKNRGLRQLMDLSTCMALPPYSLLLGGKLMALLALTDDVRAEFKRKYKLPLLGLTASCATGIHCPIFNRIMIRDGGLYRRVGETAGYTTSFFSTTTMRAARDLAAARQEDLLGQLDSRPLRTFYRALSMCGLPRKRLVRLGVAKGVYFATLSPLSLERLRAGAGPTPRESLTVGEAVEFWKTQLLPKRKDDAGVVTQLKAFRRQSLLMNAAG